MGRHINQVIRTGIGIAVTVQVVMINKVRIAIKEVKTVVINKVLTYPDTAIDEVGRNSIVVFDRIVVKHLLDEILFGIWLMFGSLHFL